MEPPLTNCSVSILVYSLSVLDCDRVGNVISGCRDGQNESVLTARKYNIKLKIGNNNIKNDKTTNNNNNYTMILSVAVEMDRIQVFSLQENVISSLTLEANTLTMTATTTTALISNVRK